MIFLTYTSTISLSLPYLSFKIALALLYRSDEYRRASVVFFTFSPKSTCRYVKFVTSGIFGFWMDSENWAQNLGQLVKEPLNFQIITLGSLAWLIWAPVCGLLPSVFCWYSSCNFSCVSCNYISNVFACSWILSPDFRSASYSSKTSTSFLASFILSFLVSFHVQISSSSSLAASFFALSALHTLSTSVKIFLRCVISLEIADCFSAFRTLLVVLTVLSSCFSFACSVDSS